MAATLDRSFNSTLNASLTPARLLTSTPFKKPAKPKPKKGKTFVRPVCDTCNVCGQEYRCHRSYTKHMRKHSIFDAAARYPNLEQLLQYCSSSARERITILKGYPAFGSVGQKYTELCLALMCEEVGVNVEWTDFLHMVHTSLTVSLRDNKLLMPSALLSAVMTDADQLLSNTEKRKELCALIQVCVPADTEVINCFLSDYILCLVKNILVFYRSSLLESTGQENSANQGTFDNEDKEAIHYIAGAVVRTIYRHSQSKKCIKNVGWQNIARVITERLLESDTIPGAAAIVKGWTNAQSRGKLFMVSSTVFDFFLGVADILRKTTMKRVDSDLVIENVCNSGLVLLWDIAAGDSLGENGSYNLMCGMIRSFSNTYGAGHTKKLVNEFRKKPEAAVSLRHKVAPRSK